MDLEDNEEYTYNDVERYDSIRDRWQSLPKLNKARCFHSSCVLGKTLYVLGGFYDEDDYGDVTDSIEKLANITEQSTSTLSRWQQIQPV